VAAGAPAGEAGPPPAEKALGPLPVGDSPRKGPNSAPVVITEFSDFQ
jgi:hypothetical protein